MGSEISIIAHNVDLDGFLADLQTAQETRSDLTTVIRELHHDGPTTWLWGRKLSGESDEIWAEAQDEADRGEGTIETITPADGSASFDAILFMGPYYEHTLKALRLTGSPVFEYITTFTLVDIAVGTTTLHLGFDHVTHGTGLPRQQDGGVTCIWIDNAWWGRDHETTAADHMAVTSIIDLLARHAVLEIDDNTEFFEHRDEAMLVGNMAANREMRDDLRLAFAALGMPSRPLLDEPLTIAQLLGVGRHSPEYDDR